jgi:hypothetical protein
MLVKSHNVVCRCISRLNFLGDIDQLCSAFKEPMMLYNLVRYLRHVATCDDPTCGTVICIDGNEKVCRMICGEPLDPPSAGTGYDPAASDVHNAMSRAIMREKVCSNAPTKARNAPCKACQQRASVGVEGAVVPMQTSPRQTRSCRRDQPLQELEGENVSHPMGETQLVRNPSS